MRERAERINARLNVRSRLSAGTEVELSVPSHVAFQFQPTSWLPEWITKLSQRSAKQKFQPRKTRESNE
jgi:hypothetical protein